MRTQRLLTRVSETLLSSAISVLILSLGGCASLHHVQLSDLDNRSGHVLIPFEIKVSEVGVSLKDAENIARATKSSGGDQAGDTLQFLQYFQLGPKTGAPVYSEKYAEKIIYQIREKCPSGKITGLSSIRESREYPVIKGEIVKITGFCIKERQPASGDSNSNQEFEGIYE